MLTLNIASTSRRNVSCSRWANRKQSLITTRIDSMTSSDFACSATTPSCAAQSQVSAAPVLER